MPGKRNLQAEQARHAARQPAWQADLVHRLRTVCPEHDRALIGQAAILAYLESLGIRRLNGMRLHWGIVSAWRKSHRFPMVAAAIDFRHRQRRSPAFTTTHLVIAWLGTQMNLPRLLRFDLDSPRIGANPVRHATRHRAA